MQLSSTQTCVCSRSGTFTSRLAPRLSACRGQQHRRAHTATKAGLESDMAVEESSQIPMPKGVTKPKVSPEVAPATFGFVERAERWNSRACMIGFFALLIVELVAHRGLLDLMGFRIGNGLPFEI